MSRTVKMLLVLLVANVALMYANWYWATTQNDIGNIGGMISSATVSIVLAMAILFSVAMDEKP